MTMCKIDQETCKLCVDMCKFAVVTCCGNMAMPRIAVVTRKIDVVMFDDCLGYLRILW